MAGQSQRIPTRGPSYAQNDTVENRKRVATYVDGNTVAYENAAFVTGQSPAIIDFFTDSGGKIAHKGWFVNDGPGDIKIEFSFNGSAYGGQHTIKTGETVSLDDFSIKKIRLTWVSDAGYRALLM